LRKDLRVTEKKLSVFGIVASFIIVIVLSAAPAPPQTTSAAIQEVKLEVDPAQSKVHYAVDSTLHRVEGTFALKKGSTLIFDPGSGKASGEVIVLATSGDSGNSSRDERMHKEILETTKYPDAIFRPTQIEGQVNRSGSSDVKVHGVLAVHGAEHEIVAQVHAELSGDHWKGTAKFDIPYVQWGIKDPSNWLLKVKPVVNIEIDMSGSASAGR
jgi:polyisoprenoid-binding protein YceI